MSGLLCLLRLGTFRKAAGFMLSGMRWNRDTDRIKHVTFELLDPPTLLEILRLLPGVKTLSISWTTLRTAPIGWQQPEIELCLDELTLTDSANESEAAAHGDMITCFSRISKLRLEYTGQVAFSECSSARRRTRVEELEVIESFPDSTLLAMLQHLDVSGLKSLAVGPDSSPSTIEKFITQTPLLESFSIDISTHPEDVNIPFPDLRNFQGLRKLTIITQLIAPQWLEIFYGKHRKVYLENLEDVTVSFVNMTSISGPHIVADCMDDLNWEELKGILERCKSLRRLCFEHGDDPNFGIEDSREAMLDVITDQLMHDASVSHKLAIFEVAHGKS